MSVIYLLKNQHDEYLDKAGEWVREADGKSLYRTEHKDEAINLKVEYSVKKPDLRISLAEATFDGKGKIFLKEGRAAANAEDTRASIEAGASNDGSPSADDNREPTMPGTEVTNEPSADQQTHREEHEPEQKDGQGDSPPENTEPGNTEEDNVISAEHVFGHTKHEETN